MGLAPSRNVVPAGRSENCSAPLGSLLVEVDDKGKLTVVEQDGHVMESAWENFLADNNRVLEVLGLAEDDHFSPGQQFELEIAMEVDVDSLWCINVTLKPSLVFLGILASLVAVMEGSDSGEGTEKHLCGVDSVRSAEQGWESAGAASAAMFMSLTGWKFAINSSVGTMKKNGSRMRAGGHSVQSSSLAIISCGHCIGPNNTTQAGDSRSAPRGVLEHAHMRKGACLRRTVSAGVASA
eukprot:CAMPEP_0115695582 /NCGR_PEP_ID=MMETSP0272-20121206/64843_1 /TAXON_ID=71861 /ORGANISM="Scrippsiella trochoidea, Strain CCMP3099" /LENGTH=237 /DNA_ID=CAMNT_0003135791 /DNA_START=66 /DNA_END=779 /DNA_ORIENTATION=+